MNQVNRMHARRGTPALSVGDGVARLVFEDGSGLRILLRALLGRPFVLVTSTPEGADDAAPDGAALLVLSAQSTWLCEADDPARYLALFGAGRPDDEGVAPHTLTFHVIDVLGTVREIHVEHAGPDRPFTGLASLREAIDALGGRPSTKMRAWGDRETRMMRLVSTLASLVLEGPPAPRGPTDSGIFFRVPEAAVVAKVVGRP